MVVFRLTSGHAASSFKFMYLGVFKSSSKSALTFHADEQIKHTDFYTD